LGRTVEKYSKTKHKRNQKEQHITQSLLLGGIGRTVENTLRPNTKKGITKSSTSLNPCFIGRNWVGLLKILLDQTQRKESQKSSTSLNPCF
jgi:hypothetical protein